MRRVLLFVFLGTVLAGGILSARVHARDVSVREAVLAAARSSGRPNPIVCAAAKSASASPAGGGECRDCTNACEQRISACQAGSVKACYQAAACLCRCNLEQGGCGSSTDALRKCVDENERLAREVSH
jgi:hypothetical protein